MCIRDRQKPARDFKKENTYVKKKIIDPDIFYGRPFEGDETPISEINDEIGEVIVRGKIIQMETRQIRNEKTIAVSYTPLDCIQYYYFIP